ncbi:MAG: DUF1501 domain-containing protein, partial [Planctomycetaceae bacterium]|nr:DUF1501 domain-containing protein [Planctomycetaceae bacterium]
HMETYDMKPNAPVEYRGEFQPISTNVPGIDVCELLPKHTSVADRFTLIRSIQHEFADHGGGHKRVMTGRLPATPTGFVNDAPAACCIVRKMLDDGHSAVPASVLEVDAGRAGIDVFSMGPAYLGPATIPFIVGGDPSVPDFRVQNIGLSKEMETRLDDRLTMLRGFDRMRGEIDLSGEMTAVDEFRRQAVSMLLSDSVREAFDLSQEPQALRDRYGWSAYGQRGILGRRLVEAGVRFVTMVWENPYSNKPIPKYGCYNWDSHAVNAHLFKDAHWRFPVYDQAVTALIEDLYDRGLDRRVLLVVTGEFGRTPKISVQQGTQTGVQQPGRDHWPGAMSVLVSGGGMRTGKVIGATNPRGEYPVERILTPNDLWATIYRHLGIDYNTALIDHQGRPMPILPFGDPIPELLPVTS